MSAGFGSSIEWARQDSNLDLVRDLQNINCLAPGQQLTFEPGLNAVFGENGSGKSGYGRLMRRVTRSGEPEEILRDVFDPGSGCGAQTAVFEITVDGKLQTVSTDLARVLSVMKVFDASRANVSLAKPNVIEHVPRPLRLLRQLSITQDRLTEHLRERERQRRAALPVLPELGPDTAAASTMTEHDKIEHTLPNGDILIVDSTRVDPEVQQAFAKVKEDLREEARNAYRQLREAAA